LRNSKDKSKKKGIDKGPQDNNVGKECRIILEPDHIEIPGDPVPIGHAVKYTPKDGVDHEDTIQEQGRKQEQNKLDTYLKASQTGNRHQFPLFLKKIMNDVDK
jgi:hypothetical protein